METNRTGDLPKNQPATAGPTEGEDLSAKISEYFSRNNQGVGVLATADRSGNVDAAIYSVPYVLDQNTIAFIMADRRSHANLQSNPHATYLFKEGGKRYQGVRLFLSKIREEEDGELLHAMIRQKRDVGQWDRGAARFLVYFKVDKMLPLIGPGSCPGVGLSRRASEQVGNPHVEVRGELDIRAVAVPAGSTVCA